MLAHRYVRCVAATRRFFWGLLAVISTLAWGPVPCRADATMREQIEADWLQQASRWAAAAAGISKTVGDAAGAVDGVKDGKYAFHTGQESKPWWHVDLGQPNEIARIVVFNRLDYPPGLHNADHLVISTSDDAVNWTTRYENGGKHFGGISGAPPLEVTFAAPITARYVRLQIPSASPIFLHLDEVEIYGPADPQKNMALHCRADQSSISPWSTNKVTLDASTALPSLVDRIVQQGLLLATDLQAMGLETDEAQQQLSAIQAELAAWSESTTTEQKQQLYLTTRWLVRRLAFQNPLLHPREFLFVKRFTQETYPDICLNHMPWVSRPGGDICILSLAGAESQPAVRTLLNGALGPGHVHGIDLDWDAGKVVFGYAQSSSDEPVEGWLDRQTNFDLRRTVEPIHLFELDIAREQVRQLTDSEWSDLDPTYLPNGDVAFVSERCGCSLQCNEWDKDETSCNLFVMRGDGSNIRRLSASKDGDYLPHCLDDGSIGYCRWEYQERHWANIQSIWTVRPDGTGADALFKQHVNDPWALEDVRSIPGTGTRKLVAIAAGHHTLATGPIVVITPTVGMNDSAAIRIVTPDVLPPEGGMSGTPVAEGGVRDGGGFYSTPWPLSEKYFLAAYSYSEKQNDPTGYGLYLVDVFGNKELIYRDPDISSFVPIPLTPRKKPLNVTDVTNPGRRYATCAVINIGYGVPDIDPQTIRYLRISERLVWPYDNTHGGQRYHEVPHTQTLVPNWTPVRVLGEVPVKKDGSVSFQVPADTPVYFQLLDENHMELRRMRSFISFQPGEQRMCVGCHETRGVAPVADSFPLALLHPPADPLPPPWGQQPVSFLRDIQPILDRHCTQCHSGLKPAAQLDFSGGLTAKGVIPAFGSNRAYETIRVNELVSRANVHDDASITQPLQFGSHRSRLVHVLRDGVCSKRATLSDEEWLSLVTWIDGNAPYHDRFINKRLGEPAYDLPADAQLAGAIAEVHQRRCQGCHEVSDVSRLDWINLAAPQQSLFLAAPLAKSAGGTEKCSGVVYTSLDDPDFESVRDLVEQAVKRAWARPRRDLQSLLPQ